jgi:hypothetical protein
MYWLYCGREIIYHRSNNDVHLITKLNNVIVHDDLYSFFQDMSPYGIYDAYNGNVDGSDL